MKTSIPETVEVVIGHFVDFPGQDIVHLAQQLTTRITPLLSGYHDQSLGNDIRIMIWEFPRSGPVKE